MGNASRLTRERRWALIVLLLAISCPINICLIRHNYLDYLKDEDGEYPAYTLLLATPADVWFRPYDEDCFYDED